MDLLIAIIMFLMGMTQPVTATVVPDNGDVYANIYSAGSSDYLSGYEIEEAQNLGAFELLCSEAGTSPTDSISMTTSGGGYPTPVDVYKCSDLIRADGAQFQVVETMFEIDVACNSDCTLRTWYASTSGPGINQRFGRLWVTVTGPNPELVVTGK